MQRQNQEPLKSCSVPDSFPIAPAVPIVHNFDQPIISQESRLFGITFGQDRWAAPNLFTRKFVRCRVLRFTGV